MNSLISIIIPVYNIESYLAQCLDSILAQTYSIWEMILIDDGSSDKSSDICNQYAKLDSRIQVIHTLNKGVSSARNTGLKVAKGEYIIFIDGDDWIEPDMLEYLLKLCYKYNTDIAICEYADGQHYAIYPTERILSTQEWLSNPFATSALWVKLFSKSCIKNINFHSDINMGEDSLFSTQALLQTQYIAYGPRKKYHYRQNIRGAMKSPFAPTKLTYFKAVKLEQQCVASLPWPKVHKKFRLAEISGAVRFLREIINCNFNDTHVIMRLCFIIKKSWCVYLIGPASWKNKCFAMVCCINFPLARWLYHRLT